jgi:hypothetical protein
MTNYPIKYENYQTNNRVGIAFRKYNYIENTQSLITPTDINVNESNWPMTSEEKHSQNEAGRMNIRTNEDERKPDMLLQYHMLL